MTIFIQVGHTGLNKTNKSRKCLSDMTAHIPSQAKHLLQCEMYTNQDSKISPNITFNFICLYISNILDDILYLNYYVIYILYWIFI